MGKNIQLQEPSIRLEHGGPGCIKSMFHHFNHHKKWHYVKKRLPLPHKRHTGGKFANAVGVEVPGNTLNSANAGTVQEKLEAETAKSSVHAKSSDSVSRHKSSMKSRIKALITEEVYRKRGRHHRSSSYPERLPSEQKPHIHHHVEVANTDPHAEPGFSNESLENQDYNQHSSVSILLDPLLPQVCGESAAHSRTCHLCASMLAKNYLRQSEVNENGKQPIIDHTLLQDKLIYAIEPSKIASTQESKLFLDALDLLNIRKELFMKVLKDPNSSLSHHLHIQKTSGLRSGLTKSVSFPMPGSSGTRVPASNSPKNEPQGDEEISCNALASGDMDPNLAIKTGIRVEDEHPKHLYLQDNASLDSPEELKKHHVNKLIMKRFKNLREKIKHAIKDSKKEKRIVMDAVLHKIPYGHAKDVKEEDNTHKDTFTQNWNNNYNPGISSGNDCSSAFGKIGQNSIRRTSSFNESLNRYNRLLELCSNKEADSQTSDISKMKTVGRLSPLGGSSPICLGRIFSLPEFRSYSFSRIERSVTADSLETQVRPLSGQSLSTEKNSVGEQKFLASQKQIQSDGSPEIDSQENFLEVGDSLTGLVGPKIRESITDQDDIIDPTPDSGHDSEFEDAISTRDLELEPEDLILEEKDSLAKLQHDLSPDSPGLSESNINVDQVETSVKISYNDLLHVHVDMKNKAEFNYVKDVLELSGFSGTEFLGKWYSEEQPVDPLVYEEVEGCLLAQPDCSGNEEGGSCNHLLLFDLINEVLLDIYEKTFSYWPMPLTCRSQVHPMPVGYHVLDNVWANINWYLRQRPEVDQSLDDAVSRDLSKSDGWMNIQFEAECVGIGLEDLIFDDLLEELVLD